MKKIHFNLLKDGIFCMPQKMLGHLFKEKYNTLLGYLIQDFQHGTVKGICKYNDSSRISSQIFQRKPLLWVEVHKNSCGVQIKEILKVYVSQGKNACSLRQSMFNLIHRRDFVFQQFVLYWSRNHFYQCQESVFQLYPRSQSNDHLMDSHTQRTYSAKVLGNKPF